MTYRTRSGARRRTFSLAVAAAFLIAASPPGIWGELRPGKFAVGVERLQLPASANSAWVVLWYPSVEPSNNLNVGGLYRIICGDRPGAAEACLADVRDQLNSDKRSEAEAEFQRLLQAPMYAHSGAAKARKRDRFPLVILEGANGGRGGDFPILAEYLASWGYVVASVGDNPSAAPPYDAARAQQKVAALDAALKLIASRREADPQKIGAVSWSFGGVVVPIAAQANPRILAQASLDSGFNYAYGGTILGEVSPISFETMECRPLLHLLPGIPNTVAKDDRYVGVAGLTYRAVVPKYSHGSFSDSRGLMTAFAHGGEDWSGFTSTYASLALALRGFLDSYVKNDDTARSRLEDASIGGQRLTVARHPSCRTR